MQGAPSEFYLNPSFWAVLVSVTALILSQLPPIYLMLRPRRRLVVEVHSRVLLNHLVGNPNLGIVIAIRNTGGREVRVRSLRIDLSRDGKLLGSFPGLNYFETPSSQSAVLFVPFFLPVGEQWAHAVSFFNVFDRQSEKAFREARSALIADVHKKVEARDPNDNQLVVGEPTLVAPFEAFFRRMFIWETGEYVLNLVVEADPGSISYAKKYRFTLYESDTDDLRKYADDYKYAGGGIGYASDAQKGGVSIPLTEH